MIHFTVAHDGFTVCNGTRRAAIAVLTPFCSDAPPNPWAQSNRLRRTNHQPLHWHACLHAQFGMDDLRLQARGRKQLLDVTPGMTVTAVQLQAETGIVGVSDSVLERKHQEPIRAQCSCERRDDALQVTGIHKRGPCYWLLDQDLVGRRSRCEGELAANF